MCGGCFCRSNRRTLCADLNGKTKKEANKCLTHSLAPLGSFPETFIGEIRYSFMFSRLTFSTFTPSLVGISSTLSPLCSVRTIAHICRSISALICACVCFSIFCLSHYLLRSLVQRFSVHIAYNTYGITAHPVHIALFAVPPRTGLVFL